MVSNAKGEFSFPANKLARRRLCAQRSRPRATTSTGPKSVTLAGGKPASLDVKLVKTKNLAAQLSNLEWILSVPGTDARSAR